MSTLAQTVARLVKFFNKLPTDYKRCRTPGLHMHISRVHNAIGRCMDEDYDTNASYACRGIQIHLPWLFSPELFVEYLECLQHAGSAFYVLDRIDNDGHYEPGNLRFVTWHVSANNRERKRAVIPLYEPTRELLICARKARHGWVKRLLQSRVPLGEPLSMHSYTYDVHKYDELYAALCTLDARTLYILECLYWYDMTAVHTGTMLGITRERVRQIEGCGLNKLCAKVVAIENRL